MQILLDIILFLFYSITFLLLCVYIYNLLLTTFGLSGSTNNILLELKIPRDVFKSPQATEIALTAVLQSGGVATWYKRNVLGNSVASFSLEIASLEGEIHFYIRTQSKFKQLVENNFYSQYPGIEIVTAPDYVEKIFFDHRSKEVSLWGLENRLAATFTLLKNNGHRLEKSSKELQMSADCIPIKTYVDYGMDKDPKDLFKHDPIAPLLEWMGSIGKGEYAWHQIIVQDAAKFNGSSFDKTYYNESTGEEFTFDELTDEFLKTIKTRIKNVIRVGDKVYDDYGNLKTITVYEDKEVVQDDGKVKIEKIAKQEPLTYGDHYFSEAEKEQGFRVIEETIKDLDLPEDKKNLVKAVLQKKNKPIVRAVMRTLYLAKNENYNGGPNVLSTLTLSKYFGPPGYNTFVPKTTDPTDYAWQNTKGRRVPWWSEKMFMDYVERGGLSSHLETRENEAKGFWADILEVIFPWGVYSLDKWFDIYFYRFSMRYRFVFRSMIEIFFHPFHHPRVVPMTLNLEELATLWHIPSPSVTTPGLKRIGTVKSSSPDSLPFER